MRIVRTRLYLRDMKRIDASAADVARLEAEVVANPTAGDVVVGLRGVRKIRFRIANRGKSGGARAVYVLLFRHGAVAFLTAYAKAEQEDMSPAQRKTVLALLEEITRGE